MNPPIIFFDTVIRSCPHTGRRQRYRRDSGLSRLQQMMGYNLIALIAILPILFGLGLFLFYV